MCWMAFSLHSPTSKLSRRAASTESSTAQHRKEAMKERGRLGERRNGNFKLLALAWNVRWDIFGPQSRRIRVFVEARMSHSNFHQQQQLLLPTIFPHFSYIRKGPGRERNEPSSVIQSFARAKELSLVSELFVPYVEMAMRNASLSCEPQPTRT